MESEKSGFTNEMSEIWRKMQVKQINVYSRIYGKNYVQRTFAANIFSRICKQRKNHPMKTPVFTVKVDWVRLNTRAGV